MPIPRLRYVLFMWLCKTSGKAYKHEWEKGSAEVQTQQACANPEAVGMSPQNVSRIVKCFLRQHAKGAFPGGQLVLRREGKVVINEALGVSRGFRDDEAEVVLKTTADTLFPFYSCGKPLSAVAIAMLEDKGLLDIHEPIASIFPEFSKQGKSKITTYDVLTHRSGILLPHLHRRFDLWSNKSAITKQLIESKPMYNRGTLAYQPNEFSWILSEIVSRIDGRELADYIEQEISAPLNLPLLKFGLPAHSPVAKSYWLGKGNVMIGGNNIAEDYETYANSPAYFNCRNPSFSLVSNAASLAEFYECLVNGGISNAGYSLLSENTLRRYTRRHVFAWDKTLKSFNSMGCGFMTGLITPTSYGWWNTSKCFGHAGMFSCLAFGDYDKRISVAIATNGNRGLYDYMKRFIHLSHACRKACVS